MGANFSFHLHPSSSFKAAHETPTACFQPAVLAATIDASLQSLYPAPSVGSPSKRRLFLYSCLILPKCTSFSLQMDALLTLRIMYDLNVSYPLQIYFDQTVKQEKRIVIFDSSHRHVSLQLQTSLIFSDPRNGFFERRLTLNHG